MVKKLFVVISGLGIGGTETQFANILPGLKRQGWSVEVFVLNPTLAFASHYLANGIKVYCPSQKIKQKVIPSFIYRFVKTVCNIFFLYKIFTRNDQSITQFILPEAYLIGMTASVIARNKSPKILIRRSLNHYQKNKNGILQIEKIFHKRISAAVANARAIVKNLEDEAIPLNKIHLINNGISKYQELNKSNSNLLSMLGIENNKVVIIVVANLIPYKGHRDLLQALSHVKAKFSGKWMLLVIGEDTSSIQAELIKLSVSLSIDENIKWLGRISDVDPYYSIADISVLPSHEEGFSNAIMESMQHSLPIIACNVGGNSELVSEDENGILVEKGNCNALSEAIIRLIKNQDEREKMGVASFKKIQSYSYDDCIDKYNNLYTSLMY